MEAKVPIKRRRPKGGNGTIYPGKVRKLRLTHCRQNILLPLPGLGVRTEGLGVWACPTFAKQQEPIMKQSEGLSRPPSGKATCPPTCKPLHNLGA